MPTAVVVPKTVTLPIGLHDWTITVRDELNHGEHVAMLARMQRDNADRPALDYTRTVDAIVIAYLVDWTLTDASGAPIRIRGLSPNELQDVLNNLRVPVAAAVKRTITQHDDSLDARDEALKKTTSGGAPSPTTLSSVA